MRTLDNASVTADAGGEVVRLTIEAPTGEQFLVELSHERAAALAANLAPPEVAEPQPPAPEAPVSPEPTKEE